MFYRRITLTAALGLMAALACPTTASSQTLQLTPTIISCGLKGSIGLCAPSLRIDEVYYATESSGDELETMPWIELVNSGLLPVSVGLDSLTDLTGQTIALPAVTLPPQARLVVMLNSGTDELDFSDGRGTYHAGAGLSLPTISGGVGLRDSAGQLYDFVAWDDPYDGIAFDTTPTYQQAVLGGQWPADTFVPTVRTVPQTRTFRVRAGHSLARDQLSTDTDTAADFDIDGKDASAPTGGSVNISDTPQFEPKQSAKVKKKWLVMMYMAGDNDLSDILFADLNEIESTIAENDNIRAINPAKPGIDANFVVLADLEGNGNTVRGHLKGDEDDTKVIIHNDPAAAVLPANSEKDTGDAAELAAFITWAKATYDYDHAALIISGHGGGWKGLAPDEHSAHEITLDELGNGLGNHKVDVIGFDMCEMAAVEVAYEVRDNASVMVASQIPVDGDGFGYADFVEKFHLVGGSATSFATRLVASTEFHWDSYTSGWQVAAMHLGGATTQLVTAVDELAIALGSDEVTRTPAQKVGIDDFGVQRPDPSDNVQLHIKAALEGAVAASDGGGSQDFVDLYSLAHRIAQDPLIPTAARQKAEVVAAKVDAARFASAHGSADPDFRGLNIYFPLSQGLPVIERAGADRCGEELCHASDCCDPETFDAPNAYMTKAKATPAKYGPDADPDCLGDAYDTPRPNAPMEFTDDTAWHQLLHRYYEPVAAAHCVPLAFEGGYITCTGAGSSDADNHVSDYYWDIAPWLSTDSGEWDNDCSNETNDDSDFDTQSMGFLANEPGTYPIVLTVWDNFYAKQPGRWEVDQDAVEVTVMPAYRLPPEYGLGGVITMDVRLHNTSWAPLSNVRVIDGWPTGELTPLSASLSSTIVMNTEVAQLQLFAPAGLAKRAYELVGAVPPGAEITLHISYVMGEDVDKDGALAMQTWFQAQDVAQGYKTELVSRGPVWTIGDKGQFSTGLGDGPLGSGLGDDLSSSLIPPGQ